MKAFRVILAIWAGHLGHLGRVRVSRNRLDLVYATVVSIGKLSVSAKCLFGRIGGVEKFLRKKNWISDLKFFTYFMPKNDLFFSIF